MFIPSIIFFIMCDFEILYQCKIYKPIAFKTIPNYSRQTLFIIGLLGLITSLVLVFISYFTLTQNKAEELFFIVLEVKCALLSPFVALEFFDLCFENIYLETQFYLNVAKEKKTTMKTSRLTENSDSSEGISDEENN